MNQIKDISDKAIKDLENNLREEHKCLWDFIRTLFVLRTTTVSICMSIFAGVFVFSTSSPTEMRMDLLLSVILLLAVFASLKSTLAITRAIYRVEIYMSQRIEPKLGIGWCLTWLDYARSAKKDNMTRALLPIYFALNVIALFYCARCFVYQNWKSPTGIPPILMLLIVVFIFLWNLKVLIWGLYPKRIIKEFDKKWAETIKKMAVR